MHSHKALDKAANFLKLIYLKLIKINDTPQKIAIGFGLGVFTGIMPFAGPAAAIFLAVLFRVNRASALLSSLLTNTWISIVSFLLSIRIGSLIFGIDARLIRSRWTELFKNFHLSSMLKLSAFKIVLPVVTGYLVIALLSACAAYAAVFVIIRLIKHRKVV